MHVDKEVPLEIDQEGSNGSNDTLSIKDDIGYKVISLIRLKDEQKKKALNFFLDLNNQGREVFEHELKESFSCESSDVRLLIQYVNTIITEGRILKNPKGGYVYRLNALKKSFPHRKRRDIIKPKEITFSQYIYNYLKQHIGTEFTERQLLDILPENYLSSRRTIIMQKRIQKYCTLGEVVGFYQSDNRETYRYILGTQEQVDEWQISIQGEINKIYTSQKAKIKKGRNSAHGDISKKLKNK